MFGGSSTGPLSRSMPSVQDSLDHIVDRARSYSPVHYEQTAHIEQLLDGAEPVDSGMTNSVWETEERTILKQFSMFSKLSLALSAYKVLDGELTVPTRSDRMESEELAQEYLSDTGIATPDIHYSHGDFIEYEKIPGDDFYNAVDEMAYDEVKDTAATIGEQTKALHEDDRARLDHRLENFMVDDDEVYWIDNEYFVEDATEKEKKADLITFISQSRHLDGESFEAVMDGFEEGYGEIDQFTEVLSTVSSPLDAGILEREFIPWNDQERLSNYVTNTKNRYME